MLVTAEIMGGDAPKTKSRELGLNLVDCTHDL